MEKLLTTKDSSTTVKSTVKKNDFLYCVEYNYANKTLRNLQCNISKEDESGQYIFIGFMSISDGNKNITIRGTSESMSSHVAVFEEIIDEVNTDINSRES